MEFLDFLLICQPTSSFTDEFPNGLQFKKLKPLLYCTGSDWTYQSEKTLYEELRDELKGHYENFLKGNFDKTYILIYLFLSGAGISKSRNAQEFHKTAIAYLSVDEDEDLELRKKIENAFVFSIGFENRNSLRCGIEQSVYRAIGTRLLKQLLPDKDLNFIISNYKLQYPWEVFDLVSKYENYKLKDMTILLIIDGLQNIMKSNNDWNDRTFKFFITLMNIHNLALRSTFLILLYTATVTDPVDSVLKITHHKRVYLLIASLDPPIIIKDGVITCIFQTDDHIIKMLVDDCGDYGRALKVLQEILKDRDIQNVNINDMINNLRVRLQFDKHIPGTNKYPDHIVQLGLIRYVCEGNSSVGYFDLPYIWIWILTNSSDGKDPVLRDWFFCDYEDHRSNQNLTCSPGLQF
ncbi:crinkler (CRN) family protein, putative [Rhizophagus clarus]|uniref:Crinkler (CRN) family protein, putative n=1 Tax=Rhizophagus clarus TaxID=94130 RepID=A0A8H3LA23_9GLOM|nr:crinkler (CRN) family protein, putative [Rhizophagus clarus]